MSKGIESTAIGVLDTRGFGAGQQITLGNIGTGVGVTLTVVGVNHAANTIYAIPYSPCHVLSLVGYVRHFFIRLFGGVR